MTGIFTCGTHASGFTGLLISILKILKIPCHVFRLMNGYTKSNFSPQIEQNFDRNLLFLLARPAKWQAGCRY